MDKSIEKIIICVSLLGGEGFFLWAIREAILPNNLFGILLAGLILLVGILWGIEGLKLLIKN